ncbi:MAG: uncharacterized protein A8A55_2325 [Amphiamblys sp. WSBS2006]|nr:MAG: uncharacterized protein A8A55_2325 [Amphiamblys sp. WSBS2006]
MKRKQVTIDKKHFLLKRRSTGYLIPIETTEYKIKKNHGNLVVLRRQPENTDDDKTVCIICRDVVDTQTEMFYYLCAEKHFLLCETCFDSKYIDTYLVKCPFCPVKSKEEEEKELAQLVDQRSGLENTEKTQVVVMGPSAPSFCVLDRKTNITVHGVKISDDVLRMFSKHARVTIGDNVTLFFQRGNRNSAIEPVDFKERVDYDELLDLYIGPDKIDTSRVEGFENICISCAWFGARNPEQRRYILETNNKSIRIRRPKYLSLFENGTAILPKLNISEDNVMEDFSSFSYEKENTADILKIEDGSIRIGRIKKIKLTAYSVNILQKINIPEDNVIEHLQLTSCERKHLEGIIEMEDLSIKTGRVKAISLEEYAACILPKLNIPEDNIMEKLVLDNTHIGHMNKKKSINIGRVKRMETDWEFEKMEFLHRLSPLPEEIRLSVFDYNPFSEELTVLKEDPIIEELKEKLKEIEGKYSGTEKTKEQEEMFKREKRDIELNIEIKLEDEAEREVQREIQREFEKMGDTGATRVILDKKEYEDRTAREVVDTSTLIWSDNQRVCIPLESEDDTDWW